MRCNRSSTVFAVACAAASVVGLAACAASQGAENAPAPVVVFSEAWLPMATPPRCCDCASKMFCKDGKEITGRSYGRRNAAFNCKLCADRAYREAMAVCDTHGGVATSEDYCARIDAENCPDECSEE